MKKLCILILSLLVGSLSGCLYIGPGRVNIVNNYKGDYQDWKNIYCADGGYEIPGEGIHSLDIRWIAGEVRLEAGREDTLRFAEAAMLNDITEDTALRYGVEGNTLYIQYCPAGTTGTLPEKNLTLTIPKSLMEAMEGFLYSASSADLYVEDMRTESFAFSASSGGLYAKGLSSDTVCLSASSGDIDLSGSFQSLSVSTSSGGVQVESGLEEALVSVSSSSGDFSFFGACAELERSASSGKTSLSFQRCPQRLVIESSSGDVRLSLPEGSGLTLFYDTSSGDFRSAVPLSFEGNRCISRDGAADFLIDTSSGNLFVGSPS